MGWWRRWLSRADSESGEAEAHPSALPLALPLDPLPPLSTVADAPQAFGYKVNWFAVRDATPEAALRALGIRESFEANWASGMARAYWRGAPDDPAGRWFYASPPIDEWTLLVGSGLPCPVDPTVSGHGTTGKAFEIAFGRLKSAFPEVQFFGSYRVVDFVAWARARRGEPDRVFAYADGRLLASRGPRSTEELTLGLPDTNGLSVEAITPDEQWVVDLATVWSVNPTTLNTAHPSVGGGRVAQLPPSLWW